MASRRSGGKLAKGVMGNSSSRRRVPSCSPVTGVSSASRPRLLWSGDADSPCAKGEEQSRKSSATVQTAVPLAALPALQQHLLTHRLIVVIDFLDVCVPDGSNTSVGASLGRAAP